MKQNVDLEENALNFEILYKCVIVLCVFSFLCNNEIPSLPSMIDVLELLPGHGMGVLNLLSRIPGSSWS